MKLNIPDGHWPPGGWQYFDPKTNYREPKPIERGKLEVAKEILAMRKNNRAQYPANTWTIESCVQELEMFTARRLLNKGLKQFVLTDAQVAQASVPVAQSLVKKKLPEVAARPVVVAKRNWFDHIKNLAGGVETLADWVGKGQRPVDQELANSRAKVCSVCPLNKKPGLIGSIVASVAEAIKAQTGLKNHLSLSTPLDDQLHTCSACDCHLPLKVWVPLRTIANHLDPEVYQDLDSQCWIIKEFQS